MNNDYFNFDELYKKLGPCLNSKMKELNREGYNDISKEDIWNYLKIFKWKDNEPFLSEMVNDILNTDNRILKDYADGIIKESKKKKKMNRFF